MAEGSDEDKSSKTEEPTEAKLKKAREQGDVPSSRETGTAMVVFSLLIVTVFVLPSVGDGLAEALARPIERAGLAMVGDGQAGLQDVGGAMGRLFGGIGLSLAPVFGLMILAALFGVLIQGETVVSRERLKPKLSKISPLAGFKRLFSTDAFVEFAKNTTKVLVIGVISCWIAWDAVTAIWQGQGVLPERLPRLAMDALGDMLIAATAFLVPIAIADILWKRHSWLKKQRMSMKEIKDEMKDSEGDPLIRGKRAELRRERARQRIAAAVPTATVVLTNPTHYAVALRYETGQDMAPVCVAKGTDLMARQIRELAAQHEVPIIENRPLARALHAVVELDQQVPNEHWQAVAEIIGYIMDLRRNIRRKPPAGSELVNGGY